jgi:hypothetical protein
MRGRGGRRKRRRIRVGRMRGVLGAHRCAAHQGAGEAFDTTRRSTMGLLEESMYSRPYHWTAPDNSTCPSKLRRAAAHVKGNRSFTIGIALQPLILHTPC